MSFEGYYQVMCENGHYHEFDVYLCPPLQRSLHPAVEYAVPEEEMPPEEDIQQDIWECRCGKRCAWWNIVDETNEPGVGHIDIEEITPCKTVCSKCGHSDIKVIAPVYKIPEKTNE